MRRPLATALLALVLVVGLAVVPGPAPALAADDTTTTSQVPTRDIIPEPNSGVEPQDAGDRGGGLQTALFVAIIVVVAGAGTWLALQSRRARAERGY